MKILMILLAPLLIAELALSWQPAAAQSLTPQDRCGETYQIRRGDTLWRIAMRCGTTVADLLAVNPQIRNPHLIFAGQFLRMPGPERVEDLIPETGRLLVTVSPPVPLPGTTFTVRATGFPSGADVDIWIGRPGASPAIIAAARADRRGVLSVDIPLPADAPRQEWVAFVITRDRAVSAMSSPFTPGVAPVVRVVGDPRDQLGRPVFRDTFVDGRNWLISDWIFTSNRIVDGAMELTANTHADGWRITWPRVENYYLEMIVRTGDLCVGGNRYGLFVNLPLDRSAPHTGHQFGVTCSGHYFLRAWHTLRGDWLIRPTRHTAILTGPDQTNRLGIMVEGERMTLFINGQRIAEVTDTRYASRGRFGVFVGAPETGEFTVYIDEIAYWNLR
jgi:LysM repeat protein